MLDVQSALRPPYSAEVAQLVEHTTENRSVDSSILSLGTNSQMTDNRFAAARRDDVYRIG